MSWKLPVSIKGIIFNKNQVILLKNERDEWELPGGRLEEGESPEECLIREIHEELGLSCSISNLINVWVYEVLEGRHVLIVTYLCKCTDELNVKISDEHSEFNWFRIAEIETINMPKGYIDSIRKASNLFD